MHCSTQARMVPTTTDLPTQPTAVPPMHAHSHGGRLCEDSRCGGAVRPGPRWVRGVPAQGQAAQRPRGGSQAGGWVDGWVVGWECDYCWSIRLVMRVSEPDMNKSRSRNCHVSPVIHDRALHILYRPIHYSLYLAGSHPHSTAQCRSCPTLRFKPSLRSWACSTACSTRPLRASATATS